jgi:tetratricopeptide (TPR) repeat protein
MRMTNRNESKRVLKNSIPALFGLVLIALAPCKAAPPVPQEASLDSLRQALAADYGNPAAHLQLAKAINEQSSVPGSALTAFLICEHARDLFGDDSFTTYFDIVFRGNVPDVLFHARKRMLQTALTADQRNVKVLVEMADLDAAHGDSDEAIFMLRRANQVAPDDFGIVKLLQTEMISSGDQAGADALLTDWCRSHPDAPVAWERRVNEQLSQNSDSASSLLDEALAKCPNDGQLHLMRAKLDEEQKPDDAITQYTTAASLATDSASVQAAAAHYFMEVHHDPEKALKYYLAVYFLDPNFNDWESVPERVHDAADEVTQTRLDAMKESGGALDNLLADTNPLVQAAAITQAMQNQGDYLPPHLLKLITSDAPDVRDGAIALLIAHPTWLSADKADQMLKSPDAWTRAAGASIIGGTRHAAAEDQLTPLLSDPTVLVRFATAIALIDNDPGGRKAVHEALHGEQNTWLKNAINTHQQKGKSK